MNEMKHPLKPKVKTTPKPSIKKQAVESDQKGCPRLKFPSTTTTTTSTAASSVTSQIAKTALKSLREDNAAATDPRMVNAGHRFLECGGIAALQRLVARPQSGQHSSADDARQPRRSLHRSAFPLAKFISLHIADQESRLGAAVGRRMSFGKLVRSSVSRSASQNGLNSVLRSISSTSRAPRRVRASWNVSPRLFRLIMSFTSRLRRRSRTEAIMNLKSSPRIMSGGRFLGKGKDHTRVYTFEDLAQEHPMVQGLCVHVYYHEGLTTPDPPHCFVAADAAGVMSVVAGALHKTLSLNVYGLALKDILDESDAGTELQYHQRIYRWFSEAKCLHLTCLHPILHFMQLEESTRASDTDSFLEASSDALEGETDKHTDRGRKLLVTRLLDGDVHKLSLREEELFDLAAAVLQALVVFHDHKYLHMDIKPENVLWDVDRDGRRRFCLSDYNLMMSMARAAHYLRPDDGGGFQSVTHGTPGYTSPLMMVEDVSGSTYRKFQYIAVKTRAFKNNMPPVWREYFDRVRGDTDMAKLDMHSLALTLIQLAVSQTNEKGGVSKLMRGPFGRFLARLMFFRPHDFQTAGQALSHLRARNSLGARLVVPKNISSSRLSTNRWAKV